MGAFLDRPKTDKHNERGSGNGLRYGLSSMQGWRVEMEDAHCAAIGLPGLPDWSFFAVFDGHAGAKVSEFSSKNLLDHIMSNSDFCPVATSEETKYDANSLIDGLKKGMRTGFLDLDVRMRQLHEVTRGEDKSGSTAVCTILTPSHIVFSNCGDSRAVLARGGKLEFHTQDHKPVNPVEKERIQRAGGSVMIQRVNGSLAVSRALGDYEYKSVDHMGPCEQLVSPEPDVSAIQRDEADEFVVLACDGVWDVMSNEELCDFVRYQMRLTDNLEEICNKVIDTCLHKGSRDNMSIVIVALSGAPAVSDEAKLCDQELDKRIHVKLAEMIHEDADYSSMGVDLLMYQLSTLVPPIEGLPPGGGIFAKHSLLESTLNLLNGTTKETGEESQ